MKTEFPEIAMLNSQEKLLMLEALWDSLSANPENIPVHDWQLEELERREEEFKKNPQPCLTWEEAKERIIRGHG